MSAIQEANLTMICSKYFGKPSALLILIMLQGQASDIAIRAQEILSLRERLNQIYVEHTHQPISLIGE